MLGLLALAVAQAAQPDPDAMIIVTGERVKRSIKETRSSVSVMNARDIEAASANRSRRCCSWSRTCSLARGARDRRSAGRTRPGRCRRCRVSWAGTGRGDGSRGRAADDLQ